jgi:hypothetical protein
LDRDIIDRRTEDVLRRVGLGNVARQKVRTI